jgi:O-antigen ligase
MISVCWIAVTFFLMSADLVFFHCSGLKIKVAYFLVFLPWLFHFQAMKSLSVEVLKVVPRWVYLILLPIFFSVLTSIDVRDSIWWSFWAAFDVVTVLTFYSFLKIKKLSVENLQIAFGLAASLVGFFGLVQFISIYLFNWVIFNPQFHFGTYRINGLAGWPHFFNIFSFLLIPPIISAEKLSKWMKFGLAILVFSLVQSTGKIGWILLVVMGLMFLWMRRPSFFRNYLLFVVPCWIIALLLPVPSFQDHHQLTSASEKALVFASDLDLNRGDASGKDRLLISQMGLRVWLKHPFLGVGPRAYDTFVTTRFDQELPGASKNDVNGHVNLRNENIWVEWLSENGVLFTIMLMAILIFVLIPRGFGFANPIHFGTWCALVMYFLFSGQVSQNGLLTLVYAVMGVYFYSAQLSTCDSSYASTLENDS